MSNDNYRIIEGSPQTVAETCDRLRKDGYWILNGPLYIIQVGEVITAFQSIQKPTWPEIDPKWLHKNPNQLTIPCSTNE